MNFNYSLVKWVVGKPAFVYNAIGTSIVAAIGINIVTGLLFLRKGDLNSFQIGFLVFGSLMLLISGYEFINLGHSLTGFIKNVFIDMADIAKKDLELNEIQVVFEKAYKGQNSFNDREKHYMVKSYDEALNKNIHLIGNKVQPIFLIAIPTLLLGLLLIIIGSPLFA